MASAQAAYRLYDEASTRQRVSARPRVRVVPGTRPASAPLPASLYTLAAAAAVVMVVIALVCVARLTLNSATVSSLMHSDAVAAQIGEARSEGSALEIAQTSLGNSVTLKAQATNLDMAAPAEVSTLVLDEDIVATDAQGGLSLADSVGRLIASER